MRRARKSRGQSLTEIAIIVALVAIATIGFVGLFGGKLTNVYGESAGSLTGRCQPPPPSGLHPGAPHRDLSNFGYAGSGAIYSQHGCN
jgi:Flp pilus assembly pilin Flp